MNQGTGKLTKLLVSNLNLCGLRKTQLLQVKSGHLLDVESVVPSSFLFFFFFLMFCEDSCSSVEKLCCWFSVVCVDSLVTSDSSRSLSFTSADQKRAGSFEQLLTGMMYTTYFFYKYCYRTISSHQCSHK